jgi:2'-5' RNA ligase
VRFTVPLRSGCLGCSRRVDLDAAADALATVHGPAAGVQLGGVGGFPSDRRATVFWVGVIEGAAALSQLAGVVGDAMTPVVGAPESRDYHPHLTLARIGRSADLRAAVAASSGAPIGPRWMADRRVLFESVTAASGARYRRHAQVQLPT